jgi:hypothetical protein
VLHVAEGASASGSPCASARIAGCTSTKDVVARRVMSVMARVCARQEGGNGALTTETGSGALCDHPATIADWGTQRSPWLAVDGCPCGGFFVWKALWARRLREMPGPERRELAGRIRACRANGIEAWVATTDLSITAPLVISRE